MNKNWGKLRKITKSWGKIKENSENSLKDDEEKEKFCGEKIVKKINQSS